MQRLRLFDIRLSRLPSVIGDCINNLPRLADAVNTAQRRLLYAKEAGEEGWWGGWAEMIFNVTTADPYITCPREVARLEAINVCNRPYAIQNQFYEYLSFGNGRLPKASRSCTNPLQAYSRNNVPTFVDFSGSSQVLAVFFTDATDAGKRVLLQGLNAADNRIYTQEIFNRIDGIFVTLASPFVSPAIPFNALTGIQKDITNGPVQIMQMDPDTGDTTLLLTMEPGETTASYRRYYLEPLPTNCCPVGATTIQVHAIAKLDLIPVKVDTDYCLIQNLEAIIHEAASARYSEIDTGSAKQMTEYHHREAIRLLNGELRHYVSEEEPAIQFAPFGSARLECKKIGLLM